MSRVGGHALHVLAAGGCAPPCDTTPKRLTPPLTRYRHAYANAPPRQAERWAAVLCAAVHWCWCSPCISCCGAAASEHWLWAQPCWLPAGGAEAAGQHPSSPFAPTLGLWACAVEPDAAAVRAGVGRSRWAVGTPLWRRTMRLPYTGWRAAPLWAVGCGPDWRVGLPERYARWRMVVAQGVAGVPAHHLAPHRLKDCQKRGVVFHLGVAGTREACAGQRSLWHVEAAYCVSH